jgi:hypothetical protein
MSSPIKTALNGLFRDHRRTLRSFSDITQSEIATESGLRYHLSNISNTKVNMNAGCKQLSLTQCKNITIVARKIPIMGINLVCTDNTRVDITCTSPESGSGYVSLDHSVLGELESDQSCMVDVNECMGITLNGTNISDQYRDSTWLVSE